MARTRLRTGRSSEFVKTATQFGSLSEWVKPDSPSVSYAVAICVEIDAHACEINCQFRLFVG